MLDVEKVIIVPGDSETRPEILKEMGRKAFECIKERITDNSIIAVTEALQQWLLQRMPIK